MGRMTIAAGLIAGLIGCTAPPEIDPELRGDAGYYRALAKRIEAWKRLQVQDGADVIPWSQSVRPPSPEDKAEIEERVKYFEELEKKRAEEQPPEPPKKKP